MRFGLVVLLIALCSDVSALAEPALTRPARLTTAQLKSFKNDFLTAEKTACQSQAPEARFSWVTEELKKVGVTPQAQNLQNKIWNTSAVDFKADGQDIPATAIVGQVGTFGSLNGKVFNFANQSDGQHLVGPLVFVGKGTVTELDTTKGHLENSFWLVERSSAIPDLTALALEAKARKALGIIVYSEEKPSKVEEPHSDSFAAATALLPILNVTAAAAETLKSKMTLTQAGTVTISASLKTEYPFDQNGQAVLVKEGGRDKKILILSRLDDCLGLSESIAMIQWVKNSGVAPVGTAWAFVTSAPFADPTALAPWADPTLVLNVAAAGESDSDRGKFLDKWFKADQDPDSLFDLGPVMKRAAGISTHLQGVISAEDLKKYGTLVKQAEKSSKLNLARVYDSFFVGPARDHDLISDTATDLKSLRQAHTLAEKGQWDQAAAILKKMDDFQWAGNVTPEAFLDYEHRKEVVGSETLDPAIWVELQKGKGAVDTLLPILEREIDRLEKKVSDNFFKLRKSIQEVQKI